MAQGDPGTITFNTQQVGGGGLGIRGDGPNFNVIGGGVGVTAPVGNGASWFDGVGGMTMPDSNLPEFINQLAAPALQRHKQQQVWDGFVAAREGMSLDEIDETQPWYTKVFGPTNFEIGAITYTTLDNSAKAEQDIVARMPELRKLPPEAMSRELNAVNQQLMTGNTYADALLQKNFMDRAGPVMDLYTKERVAWQQTELLNQRIGVVNSASGAYQQTMRGFARLGNSTPMEASVVQQQQQALGTLVDAMIPSGTQTDASAKAVMVTGFKTMAANGEWYTINALRKLGVMNHLAADDREELEKFLDTQQTRARTQWESDPANRELLVKTNVLAAAGIGGEPLVPYLDQVNNRWKADTGADNNYFDMTKEAGLLTQSTTGHLRAQEAAKQKQWDVFMAQYKQKLTGDNAAEKRDQDIAAGRSGFSGANVGSILAAPGVNADLVQTGAQAQFNEMLSQRPADAMQLLVQNQTAPLPGTLTAVKIQLQQQAALTTSSAGYSDAFGDMVQQYQYLRNTRGQHLNKNTGEMVTDNGESGDFTARQYYGEAMAGKLDNFIELRRAGASNDAAYDTVFGKGSLNAVADMRGTDKKTTQNMVDSRKEMIRSLGSRGFISGMFNGDTMTDASADQLARIITMYDAKVGAISGPDSDTKVLAATKTAQANGVEITGKYVIDNKGMAPIYRWSGISPGGSSTPDVASTYINNAVNKAAKRVGIDANHQTARLLRLPDGPNGEPMIQLFVYNPEKGGFKFVNVSGSDIRKEADMILNTKAGSAQSQGALDFMNTEESGFTVQPIL